MTDPTSVALGSGAPTSTRTVAPAAANSPAWSRALAPRSAITTSPGVTPLAARRAGDSVTSISRGQAPGGGPRDRPPPSPGGLAAADRGRRGQRNVLPAGLAADDARIRDVS